MKTAVLLALLGCLLAGVQAAHHRQLHAATVAEVQALFPAWNASLQTKDPLKVADMYSADGMLLPTVSNKIRKTREEIVDYFTKFLTAEPRGIVRPNETFVLTNKGKNGSIAIHDGIYDFALKGKDGKVSAVGARFTYVYREEAGTWKIITHHSSVLPEKEATTGRKLLQDAKVAALKEANGLFERWNASLQTLDPIKVAAEYTQDGILLPTVSNKVRTTPELIKSYFVDFLKKEPKGTIIESYVINEDPILVFNGIYDFKLKGDDGTVSTVPARFTYVYEKVNGTYKILTHHSSVLPETARLVFYKWNDALQTKDPKKVVAMYDAKGVLLPTVSNKVRSTPELIEDYFKDFLKKSPRGVINSEFIDDNSAILLHNGIYTFTLTTDGVSTTVPARYSYVYKRQADGNYKILTHHSSALPEKGPARRMAIEAGLDYAFYEKEVQGGNFRKLLQSATTGADAVAKSLFAKWAASLKGTPADVVANYAKDGVLLPTISNQVRFNSTLMTNYFNDFLTKKPSPTINEEYINDEGDIIVHNGIYTFNLTTDGKTDKVPARFTYVYKKQADGEYKIQVHHSSAMPEPTTPAADAKAPASTTTTTTPTTTTTSTSAPTNTTARSSAAGRVAAPVVAAAAAVAALLLL